MSDKLTQFPGTKNVEEFDISDEINEKIKSSFQKVSAVKSLIQELDGNTTDFVFNKLMDQYTSAKIQHDQNFQDLAEEVGVTVKPHQSWNVDFNSKKAQLIG